MNRRRFIALAGALALAGPSAMAETTRWRGVALGADASITIRGPKAEAARAIGAARAAIRRAEALFSLHDPESALARLNRDGALADPPAELSALLALSGRLHEATGGRFDPTVQPLWRALATGEDAEEAAKLVGWRCVSLAPLRLGQGQALTLNGIAQGFATDMAAEALKAAGAREVLVNLGEFRAAGGRWRIGVEDPAAGLVAVAPLAEGALATSSPGALSVGGRAHILGPSGEAPLWSTVTVEAASAALADGLSTALVLTPEREARAILASLPGARRALLIGFDGAVREVAAG